MRPMAVSDGVYKIGFHKNSIKAIVAVPNSFIEVSSKDDGVIGWDPLGKEFIQIIDELFSWVRI